MFNGSLILSVWLGFSARWTWEHSPPGSLGLHRSFAGLLGGVVVAERRERLRYRV